MRHAGRRGCPPVFKRLGPALPAAATTETLHGRGKIDWVENISEGERQGTSDNRVLLRDADIGALRDELHPARAAIRPYRGRGYPSTRVVVRALGTSFGPVLGHPGLG